MKKNIFRSAQKIRRPVEITKLFRIGKKWESTWCSVYSLKNGMNRNRCVIVISKEAGTAVERNKKKRCVRECFRKDIKATPLHSDILIKIHPAKDGNKRNFGLKKAIALWYEEEKK